MERKTLKSFFFGTPFLYISLFIIMYSTCFIKDERVGNIIGVSSLIISIIIFICYLIERKYTKFSFFLGLFILIGCIVSAVGEQAEISSFIKVYYKILAVSLILELGIKNECKRTLSILNYVLTILMVINFISILHNPNGYQLSGLRGNYWFFKYDNVHIFFFFPIILLSIICLKFEKKYLYLLIFQLVLISIQVYYCFSATTVVAYTLFLIYLFMHKSIDLFKIATPKNYFYIFIGIFVIIVLGRAQEKLAWLIVDILDKDLTFTGRTIIWDKIYEYIRQSPFIGYGFETNMVFSNKLGNPAYTHAHNTILDILYKGGILALIPFMTILKITINKLDENKTHILAKFTSFMILCIFIMFNFEAREDKIGLYIVLIIGYNIKSIIECSENYRKKGKNDDKENNKKDIISKYM